VAAKTLDEWWATVGKRPLSDNEIHLLSCCWDAATKAVEEKFTSHNSAMDEIAVRLSATKGATISDQNIIGIAVIKLRQLRQ
jgi:hypothetical protein